MTGKNKKKIKKKKREIIYNIIPMFIINLL